MSTKYFCNPLNVDYRYQFNKDPRRGGLIEIGREAADPSMIQFKGKYYIFPSMNLSAWVSEDMAAWHSVPLPAELPLYDYAPDVRVRGEYVYFCASRRGEICDRWRTKDIENGPYEKIEGNFPFWDPNLFFDDDGRVYFYYGCTNTDPIWGVELDPETLLPITEPKGLLAGDPAVKGYERGGEDHTRPILSGEALEKALEGFLARMGRKKEEVPAETLPMLRGMLTGMPYIEGAWMDKHDGKYYLQYAFPGTEFNIYGDGVYVSDSPLGEFVLAENNPYSYKPGGFIPGAGHGSTMEDLQGCLWHTATGRISKNFSFERRVGIWPAGFDADGELFCNQRYGDWPIAVSDEDKDPWKKPEWMLLSGGKAACASSCMEGYSADAISQENVQTWWRPASADKSEWVMMDLGKVYDVRAIQINFADDKIDIPVPGEIRGTIQARYIDEKQHPTRWKLLGKASGNPAEEDGWFVIEDKSEAETDLPHDFLVREEGLQVRYLKLTQMQVPYDQIPCISGLRVFGKAKGTLPAVPSFTAVRTGDLDMEVEITSARDDVVGYNILFGQAPDKLYHSYMIFGEKQHIGALVKGRGYYVRVDAFNECGITEGTCVELK